MPHPVYFFLNNHPDALIIQIYSAIKLYMFRASSLPIIKNLHETYQCRMYSRRLLMMDRDDARNM
jgi:propanediol dehydratase small subunit